jgi:hypothetical protein
VLKTLDRLGVERDTEAVRVIDQGLHGSIIG